MSGLRRRVRLQVDGGFKTGRDVVIAALLGAEEYGFGSAVLVAAGCVMARQCHLNTCPVGVATQREDLRAKFTGTPEMVIQYLTSVANEVREILALLGCRSLEEIIGRTELLTARIPEDRFKVSKIDLSRVLAGANLSAGPRKCLDARNDPPAESEHPDKKALDALHFGADTVSPLRMEMTITNYHRAAGARIVGDHGCEYMTAGVVAVLGSTGRNFGAGMSGGAAYVFDPDGVFKRRYNPELVTLETNLPEKDQELLRTLVEWHYQATGSARAREILDRFEELHPLFSMVVPKEAVRVQPRAAVPAPAIRSSAEESPAQTT